MNLATSAAHTFSSSFAGGRAFFPVDFGVDSAGNIVVVAGTVCSRGQSAYVSSVAAATSAAAAAATTATTAAAAAAAGWHSDALMRRWGQLTPVVGGPLGLGAPPSSERARAAAEAAERRDRGGLIVAVFSCA